MHNLILPGKKISVIISKNANTKVLEFVRKAIRTFFLHINQGFEDLAYKILMNSGIFNI